MQKIKSLPTRERELKLQVLGCKQCLFASLPTRERELKLCAAFLGGSNARRSPRGSAN